MDELADQRNRRPPRVIPVVPASAAQPKSEFEVNRDAWFLKDNMEEPQTAQVHCASVDGDYNTPKPEVAHKPFFPGLLCASWPL